MGVALVSLRECEAGVRIGAHTHPLPTQIANGVRLENASWRTWAKQRGNLKTINPETLNWLKDSDVTWLYGPLHEHADPVPPPKIASTQDRLDLEVSMQKKSILKHRTISEMLATPGRSASPGIDTLPSMSSGTSTPEARESNGKILSVKSDTNLTSKKRRSGGSPPASERLLSHPSLHRSDTTTSDEKRHISFNQRVDQCIAVDYIEEEPGYSDGDYDDDEPSDDDSASDEGEVLTMRSSRAGASSSSASLSSRSSNNGYADHHTIAKLAPTMLKTTDVYPAPSPAVVDPTGFSSGSAQSSRPQSRFDCDDDQQHLLQPKSEWEDDAAGGFDYFNGPFNGEGAEDESPSGIASTPGAGSKKAALPPYEAPKSSDHANANPSDSSSTGSTSSNSTSGTSPGPSHPPALPRSILKRRPQGQSSEHDGSQEEWSYNSNSSDHNSAGTPVGAKSPFLAENQDQYEPSEQKSTNFDLADPIEGESARGRPSQRLGSTSYERIQEAARRGGVRSGSSSSSGSPSGSLENPSGIASRISGSAAGSSSASISGPQSPPERERRGSFRGRDSDGQQRFDAAARLALGAEASANDAAVDSSSPSLPSSPTEEEADGRPQARGKRSSVGGAAGVKARGSSAHSGGSMSPAGSQRLSVDLDNLPSNDPGSFSSTPSGQGSGGNGGPTPLNTPTLALARSRGGSSSSRSGAPGKRPSSSGSTGPSPSSPVLPRRTSATGALVAPSDADRQAGVRVPLADDFVEEDEGGIVGRAVEIVNTARDLIAAVWPRSK
ncbi:hypothetical protein BCV69DRAFT_215877 [Microstroma glucosiphilum]|uniref:Nitrogen regulatory protein areA GATA-like domain-containing protein n=1 Tax=Pseudomicrostroma glucosiphilum TaxID=1684307 RepID=A0A316U598_9BASI|nr:hypothetical protein BCV69DRAFT_215877 [Pseudomicrostroma glucosiphilum]PWN20008.1 hypothetical protein BCV69DRAFT_215877 [Pseudomicrostroma glucosiphilum]